MDLDIRRRCCLDGQALVECVAWQLRHMHRKARDDAVESQRVVAGHAEPDAKAAREGFTGFPKYGPGGLEQVIGAINLYAESPDALTPRHQLTAMLLAEHAGLLLAAARDRERAASRAGEIDDSLLAEGVVGQAVGVIMTQRGCPAPEALRVLRSAASSLDIPLREVAERLVLTVSRPRDN